MIKHILNNLRPRPPILHLNTLPLTILTLLSHYCLCGALAALPLAVVVVADGGGLHFGHAGGELALGYHLWLADWHLFTQDGRVTAMRMQTVLTAVAFALVFGAVLHLRRRLGHGVVDQVLVEAGVAVVAGVGVHAGPLEDGGGLGQCHGEFVVL